jgi:hypothetical protein
LRVGNRGLSAEAGPFGSELQSVKYYHLGGQRIAMRTQDTFNLQPSTLVYLSGDHLGSVSLTTDQSGGVVSESRYLPGVYPEHSEGGSCAGRAARQRPTLASPASGRIVTLTCTGMARGGMTRLWDVGFNLTRLYLLVKVSRRSTGIVMS